MRSDDDGRCIAHIGSLTGITERREARNRMHLVLDHLGAPAFLHTVDGHYLFVNEVGTGCSIRGAFPVVGRHAMSSARGAGPRDPADERDRGEHRNALRGTK